MKNIWLLSLLFFMHTIALSMDTRDVSDSSSESGDLPDEISSRCLIHINDISLLRTIYGWLKEVRFSCISLTRRIERELAKERKKNYDDAEPTDLIIPDGIMTRETRRFVSENLSLNSEQIAALRMMGKQRLPTLEKMLQHAHLLGELNDDATIDFQSSKLLKSCGTPFYFFYLETRRPFNASKLDRSLKARKILGTVFFHNVDSIVRKAKKLDI